MHRQAKNSRWHRQNLPQITQMGADKKRQRYEVGTVEGKAWTGSTETRHEFQDRGQTKMIRVFSRAFAAEFLICVYLRKSAAELVLPIAYKESR
jgi:hypothetical protein